MVCKSFLYFINFAVETNMDQLGVIQQRLSGELRDMNSIIHTSLATSNDLMNRVVTGYLKTKGKQIRPIMVILSAAMLGKVNEDVLHAGAALEMLHNASLIHDDVVDETALRRGKSTVNFEWGNHIAVLVGDFFVSNALAAGIRTKNINIISALSDLGKELSLGEVDQICNVRNHDFSESSYMEMIRKKTASLFMNCVKMGAEAGGASYSEYKSLMEFAENLGLCFQIRDDIFDYISDAGQHIGKPTGNDLREGKVTLPLLYALRTAPCEKAEQMKRIIEKGNLNDSEISTLVEFAKANGGIEYADKVMRELQHKSESLLDVYPDSEWKDSFHLLFEYIITRNI